MKRIAENGLQPLQILPQDQGPPHPHLRNGPPALCPHESLANNVAERFGLTLPEYDEIRIAQVTTLEQMAQAFQGSLNERATEMHFQRIVGAIVGSAIGAGNFYSERGSNKPARRPYEPPTSTTRTPRTGSKARRSAPATSPPTWPCKEAYALLAAAHGAVEAYKSLTGQDWKAYEAPAEANLIEKKAAAAQIDAFGK